MLQSMRQLAHSWVVKGLMMILIVSFGIWGIGDMFRGNPLQRSVAKVGSVDITVQELNRAFEQNLARARQMFGPEITAQQAKQMGMADNTLDGLIENALIDQDLQRLGIDVGNQAVYEQMTQDPEFKDKDGKFDKKIFQNLLAQAHIAEGDFLKQQRKSLSTRQLVDAFSNVPAAPQSMLHALYKARGQKRILDVVTLDNGSVKESAVPDDKILRDYYQENPQPFTTPELRGLTIAVLSTDTIAKDISINDDQVKKEYDSKGDQLAEPEKRDILQVVFQDEDKAKSVSAAAKISGNIITAAKPTGHQVVPLNQSDEASLPPELGKAAFALHEREVSDPIHTSLGWHVLQIRKITPAGVPKFEDIKESLRDSMKRDQAIDATTRLVNQLDDELAAGHPLEDIADGMKLRLIKIPAVDATGKTPDGKDPAELPHKDDLLKSAFAQNSGETSPVMDDKNGSYFVVRTDNVTPSAVKPFDQVKNDVTAAWKKQDQVKRAQDAAEVIAKSLREGKPAASFTAQQGVEVRASKPISMLGDSDPSLPKMALPQILKLKKSEVVVVPDNNKQVILRLANIAAVDDAKNEGAEGKINSEINADAPKELADQYLKYLRTLFPVTIKRDAFDSLGQQGS